MKKTEKIVKTVLILRTCDENLRSAEGFQWPATGHIAAPDWNPTPLCGHGLHGLLWGTGDGSLLNWSPKAKWLVVKVPADTIIDLGGKVKFPAGKVLFVGDQKGATDLLLTRAPAGTMIVGMSATAGDYGRSMAGYRGSATAGSGGLATAGDSGSATAGDDGNATAGNYGSATAGDRGRSMAGYGGTATVGDYGSATAGNYGSATAGRDGSATAGRDGSATAGDYGTLIIKWYNGSRWRSVVAYVGEKGIEANVSYRLNEQGQFVKETNP